MNWLIFFFGLLFGFILQYARLNKYNTISGLAMFKDFTVAKAIMTAIGVGAILFGIELTTGGASLHVKPLILGGVILGGIVFGTGMAILGYCPGTLPVSAGQGSLDAFIGITGGLTAGFVYSISLPFIQPVLGNSLGEISLLSIIGEASALYLILVIAFGAGLVWFSLWIHKKEQAASYKWLTSGIALAVLAAIIFSKFVFNRPLGASTSYPYTADSIVGLTDNDYFLTTVVSGHWELIFLLGAFTSGFIGALITRSFKFRLIHKNWAEQKGKSAWKRIVYAFAGGFLIIFGARMSGGCTSGHIISGGMQMAVSSYLFAVFVFASLLITGKLFYKK